MHADTAGGGDGLEVLGGGRCTRGRSLGPDAAACNTVTRPPSSGAPDNTTCKGFFCCGRDEKDFLMYSMTMLAPSDSEQKNKLTDELMRITSCSIVIYLYIL